MSTVATQSTSRSAPAESAPPGVPLRKLSYKEKRRLEQIPAQIEALEQEQVGLNEAMAAPGFFTGPRADVDRVTARLSVIEPEILQLMEHWEQLEARREGATA